MRIHTRLLFVPLCAVCVYGYLFVSPSHASAVGQIGEIGEISATTTQSLSSLNNLNTLTRHLGLGMSGGDVRNLQRFYSTDSSIYPEGYITGYYGPRTVQATKRYQRKLGLSPTGRIGPQTLLALRGTAGEPNNGSTRSDASANTARHAYHPLLSLLDSLRAPIMSPEVVRGSAHSVTFTWTTDKPAIARVYYAAARPFVIANAPSFTATGGLSSYQSVTVSGLPSDTTFSYALESTGADGEKTVSTEKLFITSK